jgi:hypothetical protein
LISAGLGFGRSGENICFGDDTIDGGIIENCALEHHVVGLISVGNQPNYRERSPIGRDLKLLPTGFNWEIEDEGSFDVGTAKSGVVCSS